MTITEPTTPHLGLHGILRTDQRSRAELFALAGVRS